MERKELEQQFGKVWDTKELQDEFEVIQFAAPFVIVVKRISKLKGTLRFQHYPRFYFDFKAEEGYENSL